MLASSKVTKNRKARLKRERLLLLAFGICLVPLPTRAQISSDGTMSTTVNSSDNLNFTINDGDRAGNNLFHSFGEFSVPTGGSAFFNNPATIENIISRVTGGSISNIDGLIQANGIANLFLLNPTGIIFGPNASLNIGSSFFGSTADSLVFADGTEFSAKPEVPPLLTVSVPIGLQLRETPGNIIVRGSLSSTGLKVKSDKTLALVGGNVSIEGGKLKAPGGRIELGSVAGNNLVSLTPIAAGWALGYEGVQNFQDIQLSQNALVDTSGESSEDIHLRGREIVITSDSTLAAFNDGATSGGTIALKASESVEVIGDSGLLTSSFSTGAAGDITIETRQLIVRDRSTINTTSQKGNGRGGDLTVHASEFVEVDGGGSQLTTKTFTNGDAGTLRITTGRLILRNGGQLSSSTESFGSGGKIKIKALESLEVIGQGIFDNQVFKSAVFAQTSGEEAKGDGGNISINTERLVVQDGGSISVAAVEGSIGQAGNLTINANSLSLNQGSIIAETGKSAGEEGANITFKISDLFRIENESLISATASGSADGGNIDIDTPSLIVFPPTGSNGSNDIATFRTRWRKNNK